MKKYRIERRPQGARGYKINYEGELNDEQLKVVMHPGGPMLVIAGAGSGKTRTLTYRVARLLEDGTDPSRILLLTFTNKAAREMLNRVQALTAIDGLRLWGGTFHHIGNLVLRRHAKSIGLEPGFTILDSEDSKDLMDAAITELGFYDRPFRFPKGDVLQGVYQLSIDMQVSAETILTERHPQFAEITGDILIVFERYNERKRKENLVDFEDLLLLWKKVMKENKEAAAYYRGRFEHVLVDEYQDTNKLQSDVLELMFPESRNLMVVGDDAQSIYSFRGANFANIMDFPDRFPGTEIFYLQTNYRSRPEILALANDSIAKNARQYPKHLKPIRKAGETQVNVVPTRDVYEQADFVVHRVLELRDEGVDLSDIAVLYRSHFQSMELQIKLQEQGVPYEIRSGVRFFEQRHIKDVLAFLRITVNPRDELAWKRALKLYPTIGDRMASKIYAALTASQDPLAMAQSAKIFEQVPKRSQGVFKSFQEVLRKLTSADFQRTPSEGIRMVVEETYREYALSTFPNASARLDDLEEMAQFAARYGSVREFMEELSLYSEVTGQDVAAEEEDEKEMLVLSTVHQAKGLEWNVVFVIGLADGLFPSFRSTNSEEGVEEERRLFYVACTRAKDELYLTYPQWSKEGAWRQAVQRVSRFLAELDPAFYEPWQIDRGYDN
jgi:DNA helicase-2/ATP-dependent DNA helicase PcrA